MQLPAKMSTSPDCDAIFGCVKLQRMSTAESLEIAQYLQPTQNTQMEFYQQIFPEEPLTSITLTDKGTLSLRRQSKGYYKSKNLANSSGPAIFETMRSQKPSFDLLEEDNFET